MKYAIPLQGFNTPVIADHDLNTVCFSIIYFPVIVCIKMFQTILIESGVGDLDITVFITRSYAHPYHHNGDHKELLALMI